MKNLTQESDLSRSVEKSAGTKGSHLSAGGPRFADDRLDQVYLATSLFAQLVNEILKLVKNDRKLYDAVPLFACLMNEILNLVEADLDLPHLRQKRARRDSQAEPRP